jgi:preprotein translocase subunit Sec63
MPPDNGGYMVAAYVLTAAILLGYAVGLWRRANKALGKAQVNADER